MYQQIVCTVQEKCKNYLRSHVCEICSRNLNLRTDNFEKAKVETITTAQM